MVRGGGGGGQYIFFSSVSFLPLNLSPVVVEVVAAAAEVVVEYCCYSAETAGAVVQVGNSNSPVINKILDYQVV